MDSTDKEDVLLAASDAYSEISTKDLNYLLKMIDNYNYELNRLANSQNRINEINTNPAFISWTRALKKKISIGKNIEKNKMQY